jgi:CheY-like chemotaxis protein
MKNPLIISVVDDDDVYQFTISRIIQLKERDWVNKAFKNGEDAINFLRENLSNPQELPDVILLDINMPIMDGFEFIEEYARLKPRVGKQIVIYMVSSSVDPEDVEKAKQISEISDYLIKPIKPNELYSIVDEIEKMRNKD